MQKTWAALLVMAVTAAAGMPRAGAAECMAASGPQRVAALELYTSEGCDSCPPADKWVSELTARKFTSELVVPLAFHVDYWNQLGWTDPYSQAGFSERQRVHSSRRGVSFVVTPQLLLNGQDYRRGAMSDDFERKIRAINLSKPQADIRVGLNTGNSMLGAKVDVSVPGDAEQRRARVYLALYENNLASVVNAGENRGHTLKHDFVVRNLIGPLALDDKGRLSHAQRFTLDARWKPQDLNLAVFVQHPQTGDVLQALVASCR
ncbi:MAG: DUF1223 domain-containing protein [Burkholderiales bacterium]